MKKIIVCLLLVAALMMPLKAALPALRLHGSKGCCGHCASFSAASADKEEHGEDCEGAAQAKHRRHMHKSGCCHCAAMAESLKHEVAAASGVTIKQAAAKCNCRFMPDDGAPVNEPVRGSFNTTVRQVAVLAVMDYHGLAVSAESPIRPPPWHNGHVSLHHSIPTTVLLN